MITLNADGPWRVSETPSWCTVSPTSGTGKSQVTISFSALDSGAGDRDGSLVFALDGTSFTAECALSQYDYEYADDQIVNLQTHTEGNGIKLVMLGDGWDGADLSSGAFIEQCQRDMEYFFGLPPYDRLRSYFDVYAVVSLSQESGINTEYTYRDTRFGSMYGFNSGNSGCCCSISTNAILPDTDLIFDYLIDDLDFDAEDLVRGLTILIPNCSDYSSVTYYVPYISWQGKYYGLSICPPSTNPYPYNDRGVIQHEAGGHGFGRLAEESVSKNAYAPSGVKSQIVQMQSMGWWQNISVSGKIADVAWSDLIFDPRYSDAVDIYEGGCGYTRGIFRSELNSCMTGYMPYYNAISRMLITKRILEGSGSDFDIDDFFANDSSSWGAYE